MLTTIMSGLYHGRPSSSSARLACALSAAAAPPLRLASPRLACRPCRVVVTADPRRRRAWLLRLRYAEYSAHLSAISCREELYVNYQPRQKHLQTQSRHFLCFVCQCRECLGLPCPVPSHCQCRSQFDCRPRCRARPPANRPRTPSDYRARAAANPLENLLAIPNRRLATASPAQPATARLSAPHPTAARPTRGP